MVTVTLSYSLDRTGDLVWVQMATLGGTLYVTDSANHTYSGARGFYLTLGNDGKAKFNYQAPDVSGTYQVLTRCDNVITTVPFRVPDAIP